MKCPDCNSHPKGNTCICGKTLFEVKVKEPKPLKRVAVKKVSKKMAGYLREYSKLRKQFLLENPNCRKYPELAATDIHHSRGRGKYLLDTTTWIPLSRKAHIEVEGNPDLAKAEGFSLERLKTTI